MDADLNRDLMSRRRIDPDASADMQFWTAELGCTEDELRAAIAVAGNTSAEVAMHLAKRWQSPQ